MEKEQDFSVVYQNIGVLGAGAWGTALAVTAARAGRSVTLWTRDPAVAARITRERENCLALPGVALPTGISATHETRRALAAEAVLLALPAQHLRETLTGLEGAEGLPLVLCAKGMERVSGKLVTEVLGECAPWGTPAILSGPSFARDVAAGLPTAVTIAAPEPVARKLQATLGQASFRPYASEDLVGVALGGAAKNVYAIACGIVCGLGLGESARAALLARGFAELCRLGRALGARDETLMGLSGLGDLVLTATSTGSRNFSFGLALGQGQALAALCAPGRPLAEGVETAPALVARARQLAVELPIAETVAQILSGALALGDALPRLMARPFKTE